MHETISIVNKKGQIIIPKRIMNWERIKPKDKVIVKLEGGKIIIEKVLSKKEKLMIEGYKKYAKEDEKMCEEWKYVDAETDALLDDY